MATVSNLVVELTTNNKKLTAGLNDAGNKVEKFASSAIKSAAKIGAAITAGFVGASAAAAFELNKVSQEIDSLAKTALLLNVGVNELQELQFAAAKAGVTTQNLNLGLQRMTRRLGEAARGGGEAKGALEALGLNIDNIAKLTVDQQFKAIANALAGVTDESEQLALAFKFFDSEGAKIVNAIRLGVDGLGEDFRELGLGITDSQTKAVQDVRDQFTLLGTITDSVKQNIVANLAGPMKQLIEVTIEWVKSMGGARAVANRLTRDFLKFFQTTANGFFFVLETVNRLVFALQSVRFLLASLFEGLSRIFGGDDLAESFRVSALEAAKAIEEVGKRGIDIDVKQIRFNNLLKSLDEAAKNLPDTTEAAAKGPGTLVTRDFTALANSLKPGAAAAPVAARDRVFQTRDEFGNVAFTSRPQPPGKQVVEIRFVGDEAKKLIRTEVREEVQSATRFDRN